MEQHQQGPDFIHISSFEMVLPSPTVFVKISADRSCSQCSTENEHNVILFTMFHRE